MNVHEQCDVNSHARAYLDDYVSLKKRGGQGDPMKFAGDAFAFAMPTSGSQVDP